MLRITLTRASPNFLQSLALPYFCPVPTDSSLVPGGVGAFVQYGANRPAPKA